MEIWKDIRGYEGLYMVSNLGNVKSLNWKNYGIKKNLTPKKQNRGYLQVELFKDGKSKSFMIHRLVALEFVEGSKSGLVVNHKNEIKTDNRSENLEWVTQSENTVYSYRKHPLRRIKNDREICQLDACGKIIRKWKSVNEIKRKLGYSDWSVSECCRGNRKTAYGYKWRYVI